MDEVIAALAASAVTTVGTAAPTIAATIAVKGGVSLLKLAWKANKLPPWPVQASREATDQVKRPFPLELVT